MKIDSHIKNLPIEWRPKNQAIEPCVRKRALCMEMEKDWIVFQTYSRL